MTGADSNVSLVADKAPALESTAGVTEITAGDGTYFVARGQTAGNNVGIFKSKNAQIDFGQMKYYDFSNSRPGGGLVFDSENVNSRLKTAPSNLSAWERGASIEGNPTASFTQVEYVLSGKDLKNFVSGSPEVKAYFDNPGMEKTSRINGNNQRPVVDELRLPTNADKYIWGHAGMPEGKEEGIRDAFTDELQIIAQIYDQEDNEIKKVQGTIVEDIPESGQVSVYGDDKRRGIFKIPVELTDEFLPAGYKIKVIEAWSGDKESGASESLPEDLLAPERTVLDVTPPEPTEPIDKKLTNGTKQVFGEEAEVGANAYYRYDKSELISIPDVVSPSGQWGFDLPKYLEKEKEFAVYLEDNAGKHPAAEEIIDEEGNISYDQEGLIKPPPTNTEIGNINPAKDLVYHDKVFPGVVQYKVADIIPSPPLVTKAVSSDTEDEEGQQITEIGTNLTYTVTIKNDDPVTSDKVWYDAQFIDVLPIGLDYTFKDAGITVDGQLVKETAVSYDQATRKLSVALGKKLAPQAPVITIEFTVKVNREAVETVITNTASGSGFSPQETPFVPGPINSEATHEIILAKESNAVDNPGGMIAGQLVLVSAPTDINFGELAIKDYKKTIVVDNSKMATPLVVEDTRKVPLDWQITAQVLKEMTNGEDIQVGSFKYSLNENELTLDDSIQIIYASDSTSTETLYDISAQWGKHPKADGLKYRNDTEKVPIGTNHYEGIIRWTLRDTIE